MDCKLDAELIIESNDRLHHEYNDDICCYMDCEWGNGSWMEYQDGYVVLNCGDGKIYYIIFK